MVRRDNKRRGQTNRGNSGKLMSEQEILEGAKKSGLNYLIYQAGLQDRAVLIHNTVDYNKVNDFINDFKEQITAQNISEDKHAKLLYQSLANFFASGRALKDTTLYTIFETSETKEKKSLLEKIVGFFKPGKKFEGAEYFQKANNAYKDIYDMLAQDKVAQEQLPELTQAAQTLKMYGILDNTLKNLKAHGMRGKEWYGQFSKYLHENTALEAESGIKSLENYIINKKINQENQQEEMKQYKKIAAGLFLIFGLSFLTLTGANLTGNAIGNVSPATSGIFSVILIAISLILFFISRRHSK